MERIITMMFIFLISVGSVSAESKYKSIIISGTISPDFVNDLTQVPEIHYYNNYQPRLPWIGRQIIPVVVKDHKFKIKFTPSAGCGYFELKWLRMYSLYRNLFVIEEGDSIHIDFKDPKNISFSGRGASKLNFQQTMGKEINVFEQLLENNDVRRVPKSRDRLEKVTMSALEKLNVYKLEWSSNAFDLIKLNTFSSIQAYHLFAIQPQSGPKPDSSYADVLKKEINRLYVEQSSFAAQNSFSIKRSYIYLDFQLRLNELYSSMNNNFQIHPPFEYMYVKLKINYDGLLRDELIKNYFLKNFRFYPNATALISDAINTVIDLDCKTVLKEMNASKGVAEPAFDFNLEGLGGKKYSLNDFRGKIIIVDTWYNGCGNCIKLTKNLEPVVNYFSENDVVFLSVNVDKERKKFTDGVKSALYGSTKSVYVYTNGEGQNHPMLKHYQYIAYPNLLVIGRDGKILSANPVVPVSDKTREAFINLIQKSL